MLSSKLVSKVDKVAENQFKQWEVWKKWVAEEITWELCVAKISVLHNEISSDTPIEGMIEWLVENKDNRSTGSNGMLVVFSDPDNAWHLFYEYEDSVIEEELYDEIDKMLINYFRGE